MSPAIGISFFGMIVIAVVLIVSWKLLRAIVVGAFTHGEPGTFSSIFFAGLRWFGVAVLITFALHEMREGHGLFDMKRAEVPVWALGGAALLIALFNLKVIPRQRNVAAPGPMPQVPPPLPANPYFHGPMQGMNGPLAYPHRGRNQAWWWVAGAVAAFVVAGAVFTDRREYRPPRHAGAQVRFERQNGDRTFAMQAEIAGEIETAQAEARKAHDKAMGELNKAADSVKKAVRDATGPRKPSPKKAPTPKAPPTPPVAAPASVSPPQAPPSVSPPQAPSTLVAANVPDGELATMFADDAAPRFTIVSGPGSPTYSAAQRGLLSRAEKLLANHLYKAYRVAESDIAKPSMAWLSANGILRWGYSENGSAGSPSTPKADLDVSPRSLEMVYNYHLGSLRAQQAAKGYVGGLLLLGGVALLVRLGTGLRATAPQVRR